MYSKPVLIAGNGVRSAGAVEMVREFARKTNIPVLTSMMAVDITPEELHIGFIGTHGNRVANMILNECDLVISVGARLGIRQVGRITENFAPKADLIRADIDEYELSRNIKLNEKKYQIDASDFMRMLIQEEVGDFTTWKNQCLEAKKILENYDKQEGNLVIERISSMLPESPVVSVDVGMNECWTAQSFQLKGENGRINIAGGYGSMGCGLPFAIGASISTGNKPVYCITGDGGIQMNIQELETIKREKIPIKIFVLNNRVLGKISETQHFDMDNRFACTTESGGYTVPNLQKIAEAYGIKAATLNSYEELDQYQDWINDNEPCLLDIALTNKAFLTPKINFITGIIRPQLEERIVAKVKEVLKK